MVRRLRCASLLLVQSILTIATLCDCDFIASGLTCSLIGMVLLASSGQASAQTYDPWFNAGDVTFQLERNWAYQPKTAELADYRTDARVAFRNDRYVSSNTAVAQNAAPKDPTGDSGLPTIPPSPNGSRAPANQSQEPALTPPQSAQPAPAPGPVAEQPDMPPPARPTDAPSAEAPPNPVADPAPANQPSHYEEGGVHTPSLSPEIKKAEAEQKKEKPPVPDLAKGLLIAQNCGDLTFKPGLRIQPRYMFDSGNDNNDFFIRRFRLKGSGSAYGVAKYGVEMKIDNEGRFGVTPTARAENAWLDFPVVDDFAYLRAGLYDLPFSRDALTSDSKLLFMDRTLIKEQLTAVGFADNTYGLMLHGRPQCGRYEYAIGIFDNDQFERTAGFPPVPVPAGVRESDELMPAGRFVWSVLDPMKPADGYADYMESYLGKGERLELGTNFAHLGNAIIHGAPDTHMDLTAWGVDLFANSGHWTFQTEYDEIIENIAGAADIISDGWYAQVGYLFNPACPCAEFCVRYEELDPIVGDRLDWVRIGMNFYIREHNLKIQTDYNIRSHNDLTAALPGGLGFYDDNVFEVQLQLDF